MVKDPLDISIDSVEMDSDLSFEERFDDLGQALIANAFKVIKRIKKSGTNDPLSAEEIYIQEQSMKQFKVIERVYMTLKKANRIAGKPNADFDAQLRLKMVKDNHTSSLGSIVRDIPKTHTGG